MPRAESSSRCAWVSSSLHSMITSPVDSSTMSVGATLFTASVRIRSSIVIGSQSMPASAIFRTPAGVNLRSFLTSTLPAASRTSFRQRCPTSRSGTTDFSYFLPSKRIVSAS